MNSISTVIMYLRKSREDIDHEKNTGENILQGHRERLTDRLNTLGLPWVERSEIGSGDTIQARKVFQQVLNQDVPSGKYQAIAITEISRLGRGDMEDAGRVYKTIINFNLFLITPHKIYDPRNPSDLRQIRFELFLSREEFESIRERLLTGRDRRAKQGYAPNYLATLGLNHARGKFTIIPEEMEIVKEIFELRTEELSYQNIADEMNKKGYITKRGHTWTISSIRRNLENIHYIGKARWEGKIIDAQHPPLIPIELWNRVNNEVNPSKTKVRTSPRDNEYLVELFCHECGSRMYGEVRKIWNRSKTKMHNSYLLYDCSGRRKEPQCNHTVKGDMVHSEVLQRLKTIVNDKAVRDRLIALRDKHFSVSQENTQEKIIKLQKEIKTKQNFLRKVEVDYEKGDLSPALYSKHFDKVTNEIEVLENSLGQLKSKPDIQPANHEELFSKLSLALDKWDSLENKKKKAIIKAFLPRIEIDRQFNFYFATNLPAFL